MDEKEDTTLIRIATGKATLYKKRTARKQVEADYGFSSDEDDIYFHEKQPVSKTETNRISAIKKFARMLVFVHQTRMYLSRCFNINHFVTYLSL